MNIKQVKFFYVLACAVLCLVVLSPTLMEIFSSTSGEKFSTLWILGSSRMIEAYPIRISANKVYAAYLGVGNYLGALKYYTIYVKLRNQTESFSTSLGVPSILDSVFEYRVFLKNNETWEKSVSFSFKNVTFEGNVCRVSALSFNGNLVSVNKVAAWDAQKGGFFYQLFFELWIYDPVAGFEYNDRSVWLWLNMSSQL